MYDYLGLQSEKFNSNGVTLKSVRLDLPMSTEWAKVLFWKNVWIACMYVWNGVVVTSLLLSLNMDYTSSIPEENKLHKRPKLNKTIP